MTKEFEEGQEVIVTGDNPWIPQGTIGTIIKHDNNYEGDELPYYVMFDNINAWLA